MVNDAQGGGVFSLSIDIDSSFQPTVIIKYNNEIINAAQLKQLIKNVDSLEITSRDSKIKMTVFSHAHYIVLGFSNLLILYQ